MKVGHVEVFVTDAARARDFYTRVLGFELVAEQAGGFTWVRSGPLEILLRPGRSAAAAPSYGAAGSAIALYTEDLDGARRALETRGLEFKGTDGSPRCLTFTDPDGNWLQLVDPGDHA